MAKLYERLLERAARDTLRGHMPGHKGVPLLGMPAERIDFTELSDTGNLYEVEENIIREAERDAALAAGAEWCVYSAGGSTLLIQGMLGAAARHAAERGRPLRVLAARDAHRSFFSAMALLGGDADYIYPQYNSVWNISEGVRAADVRAALAEGDYDAVYVTSPSYYGVMSDLAGISEVCAEAGVMLLVDAAHGAHLVWDGELFGIDRRCEYIMCCSAHKTLGSLGGGAFALGNADKAEMLGSMQLFGSSSPSYVILASLDRAVEAAAGDAGRAALAACAERVARLRERVAEIDGVSALCADDGLRLDPTRFVFAVDGVDGREVAEWLERERGVVAEMADSRNVVFIMTAQDGEAEFERLKAGVKDCAAAALGGVSLCRRVCIPRDGQSAERCLWQMKRVRSAGQRSKPQGGFGHRNRKKTPPNGRACGGAFGYRTASGAGRRGHSPVPSLETHTASTRQGDGAHADGAPKKRTAPPPAERVVSLRDALLAPCETVRLADAEGRIAAEAIAPYPPGVPIVASGEKISQKTIAFFKEIGYNVNKGVRVLAPQPQKRESIQ